MNHPPDQYAGLSDLLSGAGVGVSPSEAHGIACGILLAHSNDPAGSWQSALTAALHGDDAPTVECARALDALFESAASDLADDDMGWQLLLPSEDTTLSARCAALRDWCVGFLFGLGAAGEPLAGANDSKDVHDALTDLSEITRLDIDIADDASGAEADFAELAEYVRVAALLVGEECRASDGDQDDKAEGGPES